MLAVLPQNAPMNLHGSLHLRTQGNNEQTSMAYETQCVGCMLVDNSAHHDRANKDSHNKPKQHNSYDAKLQACGPR